MWGLIFLPFVTRLRIRVRQPGEVRPHKPGLLACTHACRVIKRRFTPSDVLLWQFYPSCLRGSILQSPDIIFYLTHLYSSYLSWHDDIRIE
jgi:hypothetical protein